jgi:hypothetical protein
VTEKDPPKPPGKLAKDTLNDPHFLALAQHWRAMAEAAYVFDPASFSLQSHLPESAIVAAQWMPNQETLCPAYVVCIDAPYGAVVLSVRGTSQVSICNFFSSVCEICLYNMRLSMSSNALPLNLI